MSKNKFIKVLKIICVFAPFVWSFIVLAVSFLGSSLSKSGITSSNSSADDNGLRQLSFDVYDVGIRATILMPMQGILSFIEDTPLGTPIFNMYNWTTTEFFGIDVSGLIEWADVGVTLVFPLLVLFIPFWYLLVELVFFIPEVIILFIRWCKNLIYSFTQKGGFDT